MAIPLLDYAPKTQNERVSGYDAAGDDLPKIFSSENVLSAGDMDDLIEAGYRQIFFHAFKSDREPFLESQLRYGQITVREFIRGLLLSETYRRSFYDLNSNYRFVEQTVQRVLGRDIYGEREKLAWAIIVATKGVSGFVNELLDSDEYLDSFGDDTVPYQRRRVLAGRDAGEVPFNVQSPRYDAYYRSILGFPQVVWQTTVRRYVPQDKQPKAGDPALYMDLALSLNNAKGIIPARVSTANVNMSSVPYREFDGPIGPTPTRETVEA
ncbi:MAG: phycobilisome rod-core linker polypeptide [Cyanobacteria bacterium SBLK]|nr:phycobilisome rod-core linker polypeptide [Cyanobacteria bacterium SBLK]